MASNKSNGSPNLLDVVALLTDLSDPALGRGQVGTIVEHLDERTVLVDFSDDDGVTYAVAPCLIKNLLLLHYAREAA